MSNRSIYHVQTSVWTRLGRAPVTPTGGQVGQTIWPNETNTGYAPTGVTLTPGPNTSTLNFTTPNQIFDSIDYACDLVIQVPNITFNRCRINGIVVCNNDNFPNASVTLNDCTIDGGLQSRPAVGYDQLTILRCNIRGGQHNVAMGVNCTVQDSYLHDQYAGPGYHNNAIISNGGGNFTVTGNTLWCNATGNPSGGGATTNFSLFGDFSVIHDAMVNHNYIHETPGGYGVSLGYNAQKTYGTNPTNVVFTNNVFQRGTSGQCGVYGPYTGFLTGNGNVFTGNTYEDGATIS